MKRPERPQRSRGGRPKELVDRQMVYGYVHGQTYAELDELVDELDSTRSKTVAALLEFALANVDRSTLPRGKNAAHNEGQEELPLAAS